LKRHLVPASPAYRSQFIDSLHKRISETGLEWMLAKELLGRHCGDASRLWEKRFPGFPRKAWGARYTANRAGPEHQCWDQKPYSSLVESQDAEGRCRLTRSQGPQRVGTGPSPRGGDSYIHSAFALRRERSASLMTVFAVLSVGQNLSGLRVTSSPSDGFLDSLQLCYRPQNIQPNVVDERSACTEHAKGTDLRGHGDVEMPSSVTSVIETYSTPPRMLGKNVTLSANADTTRR